VIGLDRNDFLLEGNMSREENALSVRFVDVPQTGVDEICHGHSNSQSLLRNTMEFVSPVLRAFDI